MEQYLAYMVSQMREAVVMQAENGGDWWGEKAAEGDEGCGCPRWNRAVHSQILGKIIASLEKQDIAQIIELYDEKVRDNRTRRARSSPNLEVTLFRLFDDIEI